MLLLLHFLNGAILEGPLDDVCLRTGTLGLLAGLESRPEVVEVRKLATDMVSGCEAGQDVLHPNLHQVPYLAEMCGDEGALKHGRRCGDSGRHGNV